MHKVNLRALKRREVKMLDCMFFKVREAMLGYRSLDAMTYSWWRLWCE